MSNRDVRKEETKLGEIHGNGIGKQGRDLHETLTDSTFANHEKQCPKMWPLILAVDKNRVDLQQEIK